MQVAPGNRHQAPRRRPQGPASGLERVPPRPGVSAHAPTTEPRIEISDADFAGFAERVRGLTGIVLPLHKRQMVISRLRKRLRSLGIPDFQAYTAFLDTPAGAAESGQLANVVTTNLTAFFREQHHFEDLKQIVARTTQGNASRMRIWSAACSTGEEPYCIAMSALKGKRPDALADIRILATDLNTEVLDRARAGIYPAERLESCPQDYLRSFFEAAPNGQYRARQKLRSMITFNQLNLHETWPVKGPFDVIFCRNVLIYFSPEDKQRIVERFVGLLRPGGTLYLGHSESMLGNHPLLRGEGQTIFRKIA